MGRRRRERIVKGNGNCYLVDRGSHVEEEEKKEDLINRSSVGRWLCLVVPFRICLQLCSKSNAIYISFPIQLQRRLAAAAVGLLNPFYFSSFWARALSDVTQGKDVNNHGQWGKLE